MIFLKNYKDTFLVGLLIFSIFGCEKYSFPKNIDDWQPYKVGDIIVFESNKGNIDTVSIKKIHNSYLADDNLSVLPDKHQNIVVIGEAVLNKPIKTSLGGQIFKEEISLLSIYADESVYFNFDFKRPSDGLNYPSTALTFLKLKTLLEKKEASNFNSIVIEAVNQYESLIQYDLKKFWWSKKYGYTRFDFKNGDYLKLVKFIREGKNILEE
ncbi:hypothetical protein OOZ15_19745 [Galbibacter sp. EGI 63066]|uniref:hypothetical protein n=1 Tax=Galbibacter sp. EGI 63066 TaxID=2993559 RepID=UPI0022493DC9|nr:hypothetical protein [Galbibacter sp. EGI 63066]MCX2682184.1 hypothetical protein [Galbibacter sp. EGI 63066]